MYHTDFDCPNCDRHWQIPLPDYITRERHLQSRADDKARIEELEGENSQLREGMKGDYDLDAWLDWVKERKELEAERDRLKEALGKFTPLLSKMSREPDVGFLWDYVRKAQGIIKQALKREGDD